MFTYILDRNVSGFLSFFGIIGNGPYFDRTSKASRMIIQGSTTKRFHFDVLRHFGYLIIFTFRRRLQGRRNGLPTINMTRARCHFIRVSIKVLFRTSMTRLIRRVVRRAFEISNLTTNLNIRQNSTMNRSFLCRIIARVTMIFNARNNQRMGQAFPINLQGRFRRRRFTLMGNTFTLR